MMYLFFEKELWGKFKANTISKATEQEKAFVTDFFENVEKHGIWQELELPE